MGWTARTEFEEGLRRTVPWLCASPGLLALYRERGAKAKAGPPAELPCGQPLLAQPAADRLEQVWTSLTAKQAPVNLRFRRVSGPGAGAAR